VGCTFTSQGPSETNDGRFLDQQSVVSSSDARFCSHVLTAAA
jgi:hypothetical protein